MSLRQALKSKFRPEKSEPEKESETPPLTNANSHTFLDDEMCLSHEDVLLVEEGVHPDRECTQDSCRACFEAQLTQLQEQLVATMLENQQLLCELKELREQQTLEEVVKQLEKEKEKTKMLSDRLHEKEVKDSSGSKSPRLRRFVRKDKHSEKNKSLIDIGETSISLVQEKEDWIDVAKEVTEDDKDLRLETPTGSQPSLAAELSWRCHVKGRLHNWFYELLDDFTETIVEEEEKKEGDEGDPLTVRKLKENIVRFGNATKPISNMADNLTSLIRWKSQGTTLLAFSVYMYTVYHGWFLPLLLFLAHSQLLLNYIKNKGWFVGVHSFKKSEQDDQDKDMGVSDKFQLVLHVARKVQNQSGHIADCCEKIKNCLLWEQSDVTAQLYILLLAAFLASCVFPACQLFTTIGLYLGVKLFLVDYIFYRFPRIQQKYDSTLKMWKALPTDAELEKKHNRAEINKNVLNQGTSGTPSSSASEFHSFCELFNLPASETPLPSWHGGRRCTLINKDKSLTSAFKNGRLYLTNSFLCFERSKTSSLKNLVLPLKNIAKVEKAKPYPWIPGGGMALEVLLDKSEKAYIFGAIMNRDEAYESLMEAGLKAGLPWAHLPTETEDAVSRKPNKSSSEI